MTEQIAVYWDFENIHASVATIKHGPSWYRENRYIKQPKLVDVNSIMEFIRSKGDININKAYGNWSFFNAYSFDLQDNSMLVKSSSIKNIEQEGFEESDIDEARELLQKAVKRIQNKSGFLRKNI